MPLKGRKPIHNNERADTINTAEEIYSSDEQMSEDDLEESEIPTSKNRIIYANINKSGSLSPNRSVYTRNRSKPLSKNEYTKKNAEWDCSDTVGTKEPEKKSLSTFYILFVVISLALFIFVVYKLINTTKSPRSCTYENLQAVYSKESTSLWRTLQSGIEDILNGNSDKPSVYLFVHSGQEKPRKLIKDIAVKSSSCFDYSGRPVEFKTLDFTSEDAVNDYGYVIEKYKNKIKEGNVILIANLNEIPAEAAKALHAICDTITPIVRKVVIFLSLVAENRGENAIETAQNGLRNLWQAKLIHNDLDPLITRITDQVLLLRSK